MTERAAALGVRLALRDALPVEVGHLLDQVEVVEHDRAVGPDGQRMVVAGDRDTGVRGGGPRLGVRHVGASGWIGRETSTVGGGGGAVVPVSGRSAYPAPGIRGLRPVTTCPARWRRCRDGQCALTLGGSGADARFP